MWELQVKFYLRQNEDYIPANSTLNSPKKLLRGRGRQLVYIYDLDEVGVCVIKHIFLQDFASHEEWLSP